MFSTNNCDLVISPSGAADTDKVISSHENLHAAPIGVAVCSEDGLYMITGSRDTAVKMWLIRAHKLEHFWTCHGHTEEVTCLDYCSEYSIVVSGSKDKTCIVWDSRQGKRVRCLGSYNEPVISVSINRIGGSIAVLTPLQLFLYRINGEFEGGAELTEFSAHSSGIMQPGTCVVAPPAGLWQVTLSCYPSPIIVLEK